ncbi:hypothetical protein ACVWW4_006942 [Bradyrhizobium sp. LB7.1]
MFSSGKTLMALALVVAVPAAATAQTTTPAAPSAQAQPANPPAPTAELLKPEQIEALVAPIALYPDELLANVLAASTYPLEVVQADRWLKEHKTLKGDALKGEVDKQAWDDSVKALASTADVLTMMSDKLEWTKNLGDAFLAQQPDVMDAIQRLRTKAYDNKKLVTTKQQKISVQTQDNKQVVVIQQADPEAVYVPYYDPATVYGSWPYAEYPPYYFGYPSYIGAGVVAAGLAFGTAWANWTLGQLLGWRLQLGQSQRLRQPPNRQHQHRLAAQCGASGGRALQQHQCSAAFWQQQPEGRGFGPAGFPRSRRKSGAASQSGCGRPSRRSRRRSWRSSRSGRPCGHAGPAQWRRPRRRRRRRSRQER